MLIYAENGKKSRKNLDKTGFFRNIPEMRKKNVTEISRFRTVGGIPRSHWMK